MKKYAFLLVFIGLFGCKESAKKKTDHKEVAQVRILPIMKDSISIRAITLKDNYLFYAGSRGKYGYLSLVDTLPSVQHQIVLDSFVPEFRSLASTPKGDFILSVASPALLFEVNRTGEKERRYIETDSLAFYDAMAFWNAQEGIAMGDPTDGCLSIIITRDGGQSWQKLNCEKLPNIAEGEAAFAASDSNISIYGDQAWIITGGKKSRVFHTPDKGRTWAIQEIPIVEGGKTTGGYSIDFYNAKIGVIIGGDYTDMSNTNANKAITFDGGKTWKLMADKNMPGYRSCIQFIPNSDGKGMVAVGPNGISYSNNTGESWLKLSNEGFYTIRFQNDTVAFAAGKNKISKLVFEF